MKQDFSPFRGTVFEKEYTLSIGWKIFLYIFIATMIIGGAYLTYTSIADKSWWLPSIGIALIALGIYCYLELKASKIIISNNGIKRVGYFSSRELLTNDIKGYDTAQGKRITIRPVDKSNKAIVLSDYSYFSDHRGILEWILANCKDLDAEQERIGIEEIQNDDSYGYTGEERLAELKRLKRFCSYFNYAGAAVCFWVFMYPRPYDFAVLTGIVWPLVVMFVFYSKRDVVTLNSADRKKQAVYPSLNTAFILPPFALLVRTFVDFKLMHLTDALLPAAVIMIVLGAAFIGIIMSAKEKARNNRTTWFSAVMFVLLYGFTAPILINCNFDYAEPKVYTARVLNQRVLTGKHTSYELTLSKWGPKESEETEVSKSLYYQVKVGDTVYINLKPGLFKMPWFYVSK
ncbi:hypothetical protein J3L18_14390 [Mucilaginibacter gossypii]|uniref:hypothetical protein n=1 Tax=Mucilaginibacter gossypii TaxID=551996 RepID=UPI000DCF61DD|nr:MULTISPECIES: hypothetical protein [Mucilaginibacter]QTE40188.1 hypothetical protein J3L18_14390 [Mucilaginibacter gossypii]RAV49361.1 hypothetical protein DIU36_27635 [Mucilaginibacter rubeus]